MKRLLIFLLLLASLPALAQTTPQAARDTVDKRFQVGLRYPQPRIQDQAAGVRSVINWAEYALGLKADLSALSLKLDAADSTKFVRTGYLYINPVWLQINKAFVGLGNVPDVDATARANHTGTQAATTIVQTSSYRFVTDAEKATWNTKLSDAPNDGQQYARQNGAWAIVSGGGGGGGDLLAANNLSDVTNVATARTNLGVESTAQLDARDAANRARANHTGTQTASTISDFDAAVAANSAVTANTAKVSNATHTGDVTGSTALTIANNAVTNAKLANIATSTIKGRATAGTGAVEDLTAAQVRTIINVANGATANDTDANLKNRANHTGTQTASTISDFDAAVAANSAVTANTAKVSNATHTGDVTGSTALTIANNAITNAKMATVATSTIKGRATAGTGAVEDLTAAQVRTIINVANGATANSPDATLLARANHTGTQTASTISNFDAAVAANSAVSANTAKVSFPEAPSDGTQYARKNGAWEAVSGGGGSSPTTYDFLYSTAPSGATGSNGSWSWTVPAGASYADIIVVGGGGGGGSGGNASGAQSGGPGGGSAAVSRVFKIPVTPGASIAATVGNMGLGGASQTTASTAGNAGTNGGNSTLVIGGITIFAEGGKGSNGGGIGNVNTNAAVGGAKGTDPGVQGGTGRAYVGLAPTNSNSLAPGAGGGGSGSNGTGSGGGGLGGVSQVLASATPGAVGADGGGSAGAGTILNANAILGGAGGSGGGGTLTGAGGAGSSAVGYGGGGGGGGGSGNNSGSGAGGNGGPGAIRIIFY